MRYSTIFSIFTLGLVTLALNGYLPWLTLWIASSTTLQAIAYAYKMPALVCGKNSSGRASLPLVILNLPWLLFTWGIWILVALTSREPAINRIAGTNLYISRYPLFGVQLQDFDLIFDLTAEFPLWYKPSGIFECLPNLDGVALSNFTSSHQVSSEARTLIHCAQGHGRSATFASLLLAKLGMFETPEIAYHAVLEACPAAGVAASQLHQIKAGGAVSGSRVKSDA